VHIFNRYANTVQSLNTIDWKLFELQITPSKYCLAGTDGWTDGESDSHCVVCPSIYGFWLNTSCKHYPIELYDSTLCSIYTIYMAKDFSFSESLSPVSSAKHVFTSVRTSLGRLSVSIPYFSRTSGMRLS
jgi:hypothetical protein